MENLTITISTAAAKPAMTKDKDKAAEVYDKAIEKFSADKKDVGIDRMKQILKLISTLVEMKENDTGEIDEDFDEQIEPKNQGRRLFENGRGDSRRISR